MTEVSGGGGGSSPTNTRAAGRAHTRMHNLQPSPKTQTEEACCYVRCEFSNSLNGPPNQCTLDFRGHNLDLNENKTNLSNPEVIEKI